MVLQNRGLAGQPWNCKEKEIPAQYYPAFSFFINNIEHINSASEAQTVIGDVLRQ